MLTTHTFRHVAFVALVCVAIGCGGSSDGVAPATITTTSAQTMAGEGVQAVEFLGEMSGLVQGFAGVFEGNQVIPCDSGNLNVVVNDMAPQGQLSTGDNASVTFNACVMDLDGESVTVNGTLSFTANEVTGGEPGPFSIVLSASFNGFSMVSSQGTVTVNGGLTVSANSADGNTVVSEMSGSYLSAFATGGGEAFSGTLRNFSFENTGNETTGDYTGLLSATVSGSALGGSLTYSTLVPFAGNDANDNPSSGSLLVTGAGGATITFVVLDSVNVQLLVDLDGDGQTDVTINTTWDVINADDPPV